MSLETLIELKPEYYFDLSTFRYRSIFDQIETVWDALKKLPEFLAQHAKREIHPTAKIHPSAIIEGNVSIGQGTLVDEYTIIKGPALIGENCHIQPYSHIRGNLLVGDYTRIGNYTEVVNAILLGGTSPAKRDMSHFAHYNYVGYCIIGNRVVLGARVTTSSLRADWKPVHLKIKDKKYDTALPQFSAIIGDDSLIGCHTLINPGSLIGKECWVSGAPFDWKGYLPSKKFAKGKNTYYEIVDKITDKTD